MDELLLHPQAKHYYEQFSENPPQCLLVVAPAGSGKEYLLQNLARNVLGDHHVGRLFDIAPEDGKKAIGIDIIRNLKLSLRLKSSKKRVILVGHAELLTTEAQNSLLKLIEEPPANVHFMLATPNIGDMLETVRSRSTIWNLMLPLPSDIAKYYADYPIANINKAIAISEGRMGLTDALVKQKDDHSLIHAIDMAKDILSENHFKRLTRVDTVAKDPLLAAELLDALRLVCSAALRDSAKKNSPAVKQWHKRLRLTMQSNDMLLVNVQPKLVFGYLFMQI